MNMDKNTFWHIIDSVNSEVSGSDLEGVLRVTQEKLQDYSPQEIAVWANYLRCYRVLADTSGVFAASCVLNDYMSDDGFLDFRAWLISRGKEVYLAALKDPDSLAGMEIPKSTRFELYGYVAYDAYKGICKDDVYAEMKVNLLTKNQVEDIRAELEYYPHEVDGAHIREHLPNLCAKHLEPTERLCFTYSEGPGRMLLLTDLEKLKSAARLIESMTGSRFKSYSCGSFIYPESSSDAYLAINMRRETDFKANLYRIHFDVNIQTTGSRPMDSTELMRLQQEVGVAHALLTALEMQKYSLTPEEMQSFDDFIREQEELRETQEQSDTPITGQTF